MNHNYDIEKLLLDVKNGNLTVEDAANSLKNLPYKDMDFAKIDYHRKIRVGYPEVIYCEGKSIDHLKAIVKDMAMTGETILATRVGDQHIEAIEEVASNIEYHRDARICIINPSVVKKVGNIVVVTGGTADIPVGEEAAVVAESFGNNVDRIFDVGVAGIHRLFSNLDRIRNANVVIAVAGMEGALASVIGGLVDVPVIAVPTSVGYGASFKGLSALLTMLNSCAAGIGVVNIDNGFGAGYLASQINKGFSRIGDD